MDYEFKIEISIGKSRSKNYRKIVNLVKSLPKYEFDEHNDIHYCRIDDLDSYARYLLSVENLLNAVLKWKSSCVKLNGVEMDGAIDYARFKERVIHSSGPYERVLSSDSNCSGNAIVYEDLPMPLVYYPGGYGAFFAFAEDVEGDLCFCECQKKAIRNYLSLRQNMPLKNYVGLKTAPLGNDYFPEEVSKISLSNPSDPLSLFEFKENLCFKCNGVVAKMRYCHPMYGSSFVQKFGWYIKQKYFDFGIDLYQIRNENILKNECPPELYDDVIHYGRLMKKSVYGEEPDNDIAKYRKGINDTIENLTREEMGFKKIGENWTSEVILFGIVEAIFKNNETLRHHRPRWLEGLEIDIYVPDYKLGFEYQGIQHYVAVEHWGGEKQLIKQKENDRRKLDLCKEHGVNLIFVDYNEELSTELIKRKITGVVDFD